MTDAGAPPNSDSASQAGFALGAQPGTPYRVLARKYRPSSFDDLIGQEAVVRTVSNAFETGRIPQAWILTGVRGVGKTTTARILARALNYEMPDSSVKGPHRPHADTRRALPGDHGKPAHGRAGDGRGLAYRRRRRPPDQ
ncbi:ABC-type glutathione transport system ATPase component [Bradyrhizobium sp. LB9.1b]